MNIKTKFANGVHPVTKERTTKKATPVDIEALVICTDPLPSARALPTHKYDALFEKLKVGECIKCKTQETSSIAAALNKWLDGRDMKNVVKSCTRYEADGLGRVWLLAPVERKLKVAA